MAELTMPNVGEGVVEGTVTKWHKHEGDEVALDETIVEVETDKAVVEIPSPFAGRLTKILVAEGETVPIGTPIALVETAAGANARDPAPEANGSQAAAATAPSTPAVRAHEHGGNPANGAEEARRTRRISPVVLKLASQHDIDLTLVRGTGIEGRVTKQDVERYLANPVANSVPPPEGSAVVGEDAHAVRSRAGTDRATSVEPPDVPLDDGAEVINLTATRRAIARHMTESHRTIPVAWMMVEADVTALVKTRERMKVDFERQEGVKLPSLPFFIEAAVVALKEHPAINASYSDEGIRQHRDAHIGIAVATAAGLLVPVLHNAGALSLTGIARETARLAEKAHARTLTLEELRGATLTIDNTGAFGSILSQPIVPVGQVAIITTEMIRRELRPLGDDAFGLRSVINLCISFDHRALDGAEAGRFMETLRSRIESAQVGI